MPDKILHSGAVLPRAGAGLVWGISKEVSVATILAYGTTWSLSSNSFGAIVNPSLKVGENTRIGIGVGPIITVGNGTQPSVGLVVSPRLIVSF